MFSDFSTKWYVLGLLTGGAIVGIIAFLYVVWCLWDWYSHR